MNMITVKPGRSRLVAFARWATAQTPKVGTVGLGEFGVPPDQFVDAPEEILVGAIVDGHRYVSPTEDAANGLPEPGDYNDGQELLGVATPQALTPPLGSPEADAAAMVAATPPEAIERAMTAVLLATDLAASNAAAGGDSSDSSDQVPEFAPLEDAPTEDEGAEDDGQASSDEGEAAGDGGPYPCDLCPREFTTERGRDSHRRQVHRED
ncbi:hypothetical protein ABZ379_33840 [Streptomyces canus]|uniref:hypothetical protein n=1 Tax=Streptomyces canus TaxID=58343 RepID=UPI0033F81212